MKNVQIKNQEEYIQYPSLIPSVYNRRYNVLRGWRHLARMKLCNYSLKWILKHCRDQDKQSIRKDICKEEFKRYLKIIKNKRNNQKLTFGLVGLYKNIPNDIIKYIFEILYY